MKDGKMGLFSAVAVIVGACIGSAIFSISGMTVSLAGPWAVVSWIVAALIMGAYGVVVTRLAVRYPQSGGIFVFPRLAIHGAAGRFLGFFSAWGYMVSNVIAIGFSAIVSGMYFSAGFPELCNNQYVPLIASCVSMLFSLFVILSGSRRSQRLQNLLVVLLAATLLLYCLVAFFCDGFDAGALALFGGTSGTDLDAGAFEKAAGTQGGTGHSLASLCSGLGGMLCAVPFAMVAYGGCVAIAFMSSQVREPSRNIPRSLMLGLAVVALLYAGVVVAIVGTLPLNVLREDASLCFAPLLASVSRGALSSFPWLDRVIALASILAQLTTIIVLTLVNARALQAVSRDGFLPHIFCRENSGGVPVAAVLLMTFLGIVICFMSRWAWEIISLGAVLNVVSIVITCVAAINASASLAGKSPDGCQTNAAKDCFPVFRSGKIVFFPCVVITLLLCCFVPGIVNGGTDMWLFTLAVYLCAAVVYLSGHHSNRDDRLRQRPCIAWLHNLRCCSRSPLLHAERPTLSGTVVRGKGHGHLHGMPTANLSIEPDVNLPRFGVWETRVHVGGSCYRGLTNVGLRPSDDASRVPTVETFILDFSGDIYDCPMTLEFLRYVRPTQKFASLDELKVQIDNDIQSIGL